MNKELNSIMLVDDNPDDNFIHARAIKKVYPACVVLIMNSGEEALAYLEARKEPHPELLFLDINMPGMNGWEFLDLYCKLDKELQINTVIIMLTTSDNSDDVQKAKMMNSISDYITKPLTQEKLHSICGKYFLPPCIEK